MVEEEIKMHENNLNTGLKANLVPVKTKVLNTSTEEISVHGLNIRKRTQPHPVFSNPKKLNKVFQFFSFLKI